MLITVKENSCAGIPIGKMQAVKEVIEKSILFKEREELRGGRKMSYTGEYNMKNLWYFFPSSREEMNPPDKFYMLYFIYVYVLYYFWLSYFLIKLKYSLKRQIILQGILGKTSFSTFQPIANFQGKTIFQLFSCCTGG